MDMGSFIAGGVFALVCAATGGFGAWLAFDRLIHKPTIRRLHTDHAAEVNGYRDKLSKAEQHAAQAEKLMRENEGT